MIERRKLVTGLAAILAMPAVARADSLMKIRGDRYFYWEYSCPMVPDPFWFGGLNGGVSRQDLIDACFGPNGGLYIGKWTMFGKDRNIYSDQVVGFRKVEAPRYVEKSVLVGCT